MRWTLVVIAAMGLIAAGCGGTDGDGAGVSEEPVATDSPSDTPATDSPSFSQALKSGASCSELFEIRNEVDPKSPLIEEMNDQLREVGCGSSGDERTDQPGEEQPGGFTGLYADTYKTAKSVCKSFPLRKAAKELGLPASSDEVTVAEKFSRELYTAPHQQAAFEGLPRRARGQGPGLINAPARFRPYRRGLAPVRGYDARRIGKATPRDLAHMRGGTMSSDDDDRAVARIAIYIKREALGGSSQTASET